MEITFIHIVYILFLIDSLTAVWIAWWGASWFTNTFGPLARWFPPAKGWSLYYLLWVIFVGVLLFV